MKKKLAILLASVMALSSVSINVFASTTNDLSKTPIVVPEKTVFTEETGSNFSGPMAEDTDDIKYMVDGSTLNIKAKSQVTTGAVIRLELKNAKWFFRQDGGNGYDAVTKTWSDADAKLYNIQTAAGTSNRVGGSLVGTGASPAGLSTFVQNYGGSKTNPSIQGIGPSNAVGRISLPSGGTVGTLYQRFVYNVATGTSSKTTPVFTGTNIDPKASTTIHSAGSDMGLANGAVYSLRVRESDDSIADLTIYRTLEIDDSIDIPLVTRTIQKGDISVAVDSQVASINNTNHQYGATNTNATKSYVKTPVDAYDEFVIDKLIINETRLNSMEYGSFQLILPSGFTFLNNIVNEKKGVATDDADQRLMKGTFEGGLSGNGTIDGESTVGVSSGTISVYDDYPYMYTLDNSVTPASDIKWNKTIWEDVFVRNMLKVGELIPSTAIPAPAPGEKYYPNYEFKANPTYKKTIKETADKVGSSGFRFKQIDNNAIDYSTLIVTLPSGFTQSTSATGSLYITGLTILADEGAPMGPINMQVKNVNSSNTVVTNETIVASTRVQRTIRFEAIAPIPELVSGRYENADQETGAANANDDLHLTAEVIFAERSVASWWAERETKFTLPEEAKYRKVQITEADEFYDLDNSDYEEALKTPGIFSTTADKLTSTTTNYSDTSRTYTLSGFSEDEYPNDGKRHQYVTIDDNVMTLQNLKIKKDEKAYLQMKLWVSIQAGFEGDLKLTATGSSVGKDDLLETITIAKVIKPVTITAKVTDMKIGYQELPVADFTITETKAGMLEKGKEVRVSISDSVSSDMAFVEGFKWDVAADGFTIKNGKVYAGTVGSAIGSLGKQGRDNATLYFTIDKQSSTKAGSITFSNIKLKIDRTIPESSKPYDIYVWGTAVAENFGPLKDQFQVEGIKAPYVSVVTSANDKGSSLSTLVKVTIGDPVAIVGNTTIQMDTAAYISSESQSTMVPVRFISLALGVPEEKVQWDPVARTVTVDAGSTNSSNKFQFKIGSDQINLGNGLSTTMLSPDGTPVKAEIKDGRSFIPFRALGNALGITSITYDPATKTAIYNGDKEIVAAQ